MALWMDDYQPELHYMRGPGPKWLEKHVGISGPATATNEGARKPRIPFRSLELRLRKWLPMRWRDQLGDWSV